MVVHLVGEAGGPGLIETVELVEIDGITIGHEHAMETDGQPPLAETRDLLDIAQQKSASGNQHMLSVLAIHGVGDHDFHRPGEIADQPVEQRGIENRAFK